jgi:hypothetical protein
MDINATHLLVGRPEYPVETLVKKDAAQRSKEMNEEASQKVGNVARQGFLKIVDTEIRGQLGLAGGMENSYSLLPETEYDTLEITDRLLKDFAVSVVHAQEGGKSGTQLQEMIKRAKGQIHQGIENADAVLSGLGVEGSREDINSIVDGLEQGLDKLSASFDRFKPQLQNGGDIERRRFFSLQLTTLDGDQINVQMRLGANSSSRLKIQWRNGGPSFELDTTREVYSSLKFNIKGNLDDREQHALQQVLDGVNKMADDFFAGKFSFGGVSVEWDESIIRSYKLVSSEEGTETGFSGLQAWGTYPEDFQRTGIFDKLMANSSRESAGNLLKLLDSIKLAEKSEEALKTMVTKRFQADPRYTDSKEEDQFLDNLDTLFALARKEISL